MVVNLENATQSMLDLFGIVKIEIALSRKGYY